MADRSSEARTLRHQGLIYKEIGEALGVDKMTAYRMVNAEAREADRARKRRWRQKRSRQELIQLAYGEVPPDTRTMTGRAMGDPLPGRSALDLRGR